MAVLTGSRREREPKRPRLTPVLIGMMSLGLLAAQPFAARAPQASGTQFVYRGDTYIMDQFTMLFGGTELGKVRTALFTTYLTTAEGKARVTRAGSADLERVWNSLDVEEKTTFLAITAATDTLETSAGMKMLSFIAAIDEIHGSQKLDGSGEYDNDEAFRLDVHLTDEALKRLKNQNERYASTCTQRQFGYGGAGSRHPNFCLFPKKIDFESTVKTDNKPNVQFNVTPASRCGDVDLDYDFLRHLTKDNSNVIARGDFNRQHAGQFIRQYCDPGFRP